jgi:general secretion pathway protein B
MSLILDALRKMEEDRKSRRSAALNIRPEVLRYRALVKPPQGKPYLLAALALVLLAVGIGAGVFLKGNRGATDEPSAESKRSELAAAPAMSVPAPVAAAQPSAAPPVLPAVQPAPAAMAPAASLPVTALPAAAAAKSAPAAAADPLEDPASVRARRAAAARSAREEAAGSPQSRPSRRDGAEELQPAPADITISGIAWQDERSLRRAVLNGTLVGEGVEIAGARVLEIRENKVRMSRGGQTFEVVFSSR